MKKNAKKVKYDYTVNVSDIRGLEDIDCVFALAKQNAGLPITDEELVAIVTRVCEECTPKITFVCCEREKKPWYKRFWSKVKRAFKR